MAYMQNLLCLTFLRHLLTQEIKMTVLIYNASAVRTITRLTLVKKQQHERSKV